MAKGNFKKKAEKKKDNDIEMKANHSHEIETLVKNDENSGEEAKNIDGKNYVQRKTKWNGMRGK